MQRLTFKVHDDSGYYEGYKLVVTALPGGEFGGEWSAKLLDREGKPTTRFFYRMKSLTEIVEAFHKHSQTSVLGELIGFETRE